MVIALLLVSGHKRHPQIVPFWPARDLIRIGEKNPFDLELEKLVQCVLCVRLC